MSGVQRSKGAAIHWFRKGLRLSDNPALLEACCEGSKLYPVFIIDPKFCQGQMSINRHSFLLQCLHDLDQSLRGLGSRLFVARGQPEIVLPELTKKWDVSLLTYEGDTGPYSQVRDEKVMKTLQTLGCKTSAHYTHTLFPMDQLHTKWNKSEPPKSYQSFMNLFKSMGAPRKPVASPSIGDMPRESVEINMSGFSIPTLSDLGFAENEQPSATDVFPGGESEGLKRLQQTICARPQWVSTFAKPQTAPNAISPSTTVLGPYLTMGCISVSTFFYEVVKLRPKTDPPESLIGQLLWREYFYYSSFTTPNFDKMLGNAAHCKQIPWRRDADLIAAWKEARTGFPFIDAIMTQLRVQGWIHHLARHAVACFLTRGDLWQHWEEGAKHFEFTLLDGDYALNNANWQWLSCSRFFYQYGRCYSPISFGKKTDKNGDYIRKWLPQLANMPAKYIYEPWLAPIEVQKSAGCIIGENYPQPLVDHSVVSKENMGKMQAAYELQKKGGDVVMPDPTPLGFCRTAKDSAVIPSEENKDSSPSSSSRKMKLGPETFFAKKKAKT